MLVVVTVLKMEAKNFFSSFIAFYVQMIQKY
jgi:hypothetical protein